MFTFNFFICCSSTSLADKSQTQAMAFIDDNLFNDEGQDPLAFDVTQLLLNFQMNEPIFDNHLLNPTPVESEIIHFEGENVVQGTLEALVCVLTSPQVVNYTNLVDFFLTFRSFIDPLPLLELILCRLSWSLKATSPAVLIRTFVCLRHWLLNHFQDYISDPTLRILFANTINEMCKYREFMDSVVKKNCLRDLKRAYLQSCKVYFKNAIPDTSEDILYIDLDTMECLPRLSQIALMNLTDPSTRRSGILSMLDQPKLQNMVRGLQRPSSFKQLESLHAMEKPRAKESNDETTSLDRILSQLEEEVEPKGPLEGVITFDNLQKHDFGFALNGKVELFTDSSVNAIQKEKTHKPKVEQKPVKASLPVASPKQTATTKPVKQKKTFLKLIFGKREPLHEIKPASQQPMKRKSQPKTKPTIRSSTILDELESAIDPSGKLDFISELIIQDYKSVVKSHPNKKRLSIPLSFKDNSEVIDWSNSNINGEEHASDFIDMNVESPIARSHGWSVGSQNHSYVTYDSDFSDVTNRMPETNFAGQLRRKDAISNLRLPTDASEEGLYSVHGELQGKVEDLGGDFETSSQLYENSNQELAIEEDGSQLSDTQSKAAPIENSDNDELEFQADTSQVTPILPQNTASDHDGFDFHDTTPVRPIHLETEPGASESDSNVFRFDHSIEEQDNSEMINLTQFTQHESPLCLRKSAPESSNETGGSSFLVGFGNGPPVSFGSSFSKPDESPITPATEAFTVSPMAPVAEDFDRFTFETQTNTQYLNELPFSKSRTSQVSMIPSPIASVGQPNYNGISQTDINELARIPDEDHDGNPINWTLNKLRGQTPKQQQDSFEPQVVYGLNDEFTPETPKSPHENHKKHAVGIICQSPTKELDLERQIRDLYISSGPGGAEAINRLSTSSLPLEMNVINRSGSILTRTSTSKLLLNEGEDAMSNFDLQSLTLVPKSSFNIDSVMASGKHIPFILEYDLSKILDQFTLIERDILMDVDWKELINLKFDNVLTPFNSWLRVLLDNAAKTGVELVTLRFNLMTNWVKSEILLCKDLSLRILTITKYIQLAWLALQHQNFATLFQILFALSSDILKNLKSTWIRIDPGSILKLKKLRDLVSATDNFKSYRTKLESIQMSKGVIPFLPLDLSDLTSNSELPTIVKGPCDEDEDSYDLINFQKLQSGCKIVKNIIRTIEWSRFFSISMDPSLLSKCLYVGCLSEEEMLQCLELIDG